MKVTFYGAAKAVTGSCTLLECGGKHIVHNMLVDPQMNMLEVQSLCAEFNKLYPHERTMMLFEDVVLKRTKNKAPSLSDQIQSASTRAAEAHSTDKATSKETTPER